MFSQKSDSDILARVGCTDRKSLFLWVFSNFDTPSVGFWRLVRGASFLIRKRRSLCIWICVAGSGRLCRG